MYFTQTISITEEEVSVQGNAVRAETITQGICFMVVMMLINMADGEGFGEQLDYIEPGFRIVSADTITICIMCCNENKRQVLRTKCKRTSSFESKLRFLKGQ